MSPILFSIYIDELFVQLKQAGLGCYIGHLFAGIVGYADDINLLAPTKAALSKMLDITNQFGVEFKIKFNPDKSKLVIFEGNKRVIGSIVFNGSVIESDTTPYVIHLGNQLGPIFCKEFMLKRIYDFIRRVNILYAKFKFISSSTRYSLFKSYCMSLYGCQLWDLDSKHMELFYVAWRKCVRRIFKLNNRTHCALLSHICCDAPIKVQLIHRFNKFSKGVLKSNIFFVKYCGQLAANGSRSTFCNNVNVANVHRYCFDTIDTHALQQTAGAIKDFIRMWDISPDDDNLKCIIDYLCTL